MPKAVNTAAATKDLKYTARADAAPCARSTASAMLVRRIHVALTGDASFTQVVAILEYPGAATDKGTDSTRRHRCRLRRAAAHTQRDADAEGDLSEPAAFPPLSRPDVGASQRGGGGGAAAALNGGPVWPDDSG